MLIQVISLFPNVFTEYLGTSMMLKATKNNLVNFEFINLRDFGLGPRLQVDDYPYGGGDGMLLMVEPLYRAITKAKKKDPTALVVLPSPRGELYNQTKASKYALDQRGLILVCPHYEGYDERIVKWVDELVCVGQYVLTGGELPALCIIDSVVRLIPGVLGGETSVINESFSQDLNFIEHPQYTRPEVFKGLSVPKVLISGHHQNIQAWKEDSSTSL